VGIWEWLKGNPEKKYRERFPEREKPSEPPAEEPEEPTPAPAAEELDEQTSEPLPEESGEPTPESAAEKPEELTPETPAEKIDKQAPEDLSEATEEPPPSPIAEEPEELAPEPPAEKAEETTSEPLSEETEEPTLEPLSEEIGEPASAPLAEEPIELPPEPPTQETEKPRPKRRKLGFGGFGGALKKQKPKQPKKKEKESTPDPEFFKLLIFPITLASMLLGLSIMPLFPQPLPAILAFLIAFVTYKKPRIGMPIGGLTVGLGLMYNLAQMNFISMLGATEMREAFVFVLLFLFTALPVIFHSRRAVISINLGIIAAILLFFSQTYFLAIPVIFTAVVFFKKISFLTVVYYGLISVPFQIMQYLNLVLPIERWDWWIEPGTSPPVYVPLTEIFTNVQESMLQFRLYDTSKVVYAIRDQITLDPPVMPHTALEIISHYFDSLPGIVLFLFMVIGIVSAFVFFARTFFSKSSISYAERLLPTMSATIGVALFFILAASLQGALAFRVDVNGAQMAIATFATLLFTLPTLLIDYTPKRRATVDMIMEKAKDLKAKLLLFEEELDEVKRNLPISTGSFEVKTMIVRDRLNDVLSKASARLEAASEIDKIFNEIDSLSREIDNLTAELYVAVGEYQIFVNCEYSKWLGMFKDIGLETEVTAEAAFQPEAPLGTRIEQIKEVTEKGQAFATEIINVAEQGYDIIRSFYDPGLPEENQSIAFARKKLGEKAAPWIALDALFTALNNWNKQYKAQISKSIGYLKDSLTSIANLSTQSERLQVVLGDDFPRMLANVEKAEGLKLDVEKRTLNVINGLAIKDVFQSSLSVAGDVFSVLDEKLKSKEKAIENLAPSEEFLWEKNDALRNQLTSVIEITSKPSKVNLSEVLESLPKFLSHIDECLKTIALYKYTEELLLNYPIAEKAVERLLSEKKRISVEDLPFEPKYAEEYLKLFYSQRYREFSLDKANMLLTKKT
jgi:chemotaxis protein histidine kinase CheA